MNKKELRALHEKEWRDLLGKEGYFEFISNARALMAMNNPDGIDFIKFLSDGENKSMFYISDGKGFQITFSNGFTASVQFGEFNYCEYYVGLKKPKIRKKGKNAHSRDAEVACFDKDGNLISLEGYDKERVDKVIGFLTANEVLDFMNWVANLPPDYAEH